MISVWSEYGCESLNFSSLSLMIELFVLRLLTLFPDYIAEIQSQKPRHKIYDEQEKDQ